MIKAIDLRLNEQDLRKCLREILDEVEIARTWGADPSRAMIVDMAVTKIKTKNILVTEDVS